MSISDGEFFSLFKRMAQRIYKDPTGVPQVQAKDLKRPQKRSIITSNGANWDRIYVDRPLYIWTPDKRQINYVPGNNPGDISADTSRPYFSSISGYVKLFAPGEWFINTPLIAGDVENGKTTMLHGEVPPNDVNFTPADVIGQLSPASFQDLRAIGGTAQTGADLGALVIRLLAKYLPVVWGNEAIVAYAAADGAVLAANAARRGLAFWNTSATQTVALTIKNPATQLAGFLVLPPLAGYTYGPLDLPTTQIIRSWGSGVGNLSVVEGT